MTIKLPKDPKDHDYEDQISAMLLASGYYLETRLILKKGTEEVLEFDAIVTPVNDYTNRKIVEVKSGGWGLSDLFKLYGQTMYTRHQAAWLIHKQPLNSTKKEALAGVCESIPVKTFRVNIQDKQTSSDEIPTAIDMDDSFRHLILATAWWSRIADRIAQAKFKQWLKSEVAGAEILHKARVYCTQLENSLFKDSPLRRADAMYDAYKAAPQLTSALIGHVVEQSGEDLKQVRKSVTDTAQRVYLQYIMALEQKARIAIIKNAYDAVLLEKATSDEKKPWSGASWNFYKAVLPPAFPEGMQALDAYAHAHSAAYFLQVFIEVLGGFYFPNDPEDVKLVAGVTGVPPDTIPQMVGMLDLFFPIPAGWVFKGQGDMHFIKGVPAYVRGAGCFAREFVRGANWSSESPSPYWTIKWHNALYEVLKPTLGAEAMG
jgi:hypothetical protein